MAAEVGGAPGELFEVKVHSRHFLRGTAGVGISGPAAQAARLSGPGLCPRHGGCVSTSRLAGGDELGRLLRV